MGSGEEKELGQEERLGRPGFAAAWVGRVGRVSWACAREGGGRALGRLGLGSGKREGGSDGPDWVGFWFRVGLGFGFGSGLGFLFFSFYFFSKSKSNKV